MKAASWDVSLTLVNDGFHHHYSAVYLDHQHWLPKLTLQETL